MEGLLAGSFQALRGLPGARGIEESLPRPPAVGVSALLRALKARCWCSLSRREPAADGSLADLLVGRFGKDLLEGRSSGRPAVSGGRLLERETRPGCRERSSPATPKSSTARFPPPVPPRREDRSAERPEAERLVLAPAEAKRRPVEPAYPPPRWEGGKEKGKGKGKVKGKSPKGKGEGAWPKRSKGVKHRSRQERWWAEGGPGYERARERSRSPRSSEVEEVKEDTAAQEEREEEEFRVLDLLGDRRPRGEEEIERDLELEEAEEVLPSTRRPVPLEGESQAEAWTLA